MLAGNQSQRLIELGLAEFAPDWEVVGPCVELSVSEPNDWLSGAGSYGVTLRHRRTGALKVVGRRRGEWPDAGYHRGLSFRVLDAYAERNIDPMLRFFQEIGVADRSTSARRTMGRRMPPVPPPPPVPRDTRDGASERPPAVRRSADPPPPPSGSKNSPPSGSRHAPPSGPKAPPPSEPKTSRHAAPVERTGRGADRRIKRTPTREKITKILALSPALIKRLLKRRRRAPDALDNVTGTVFSGSSPVMELMHVKPMFSVSGKTVRLVLTFAHGEGVVVFECNRVVHARFAGQTGEEALASILTAYGVRQEA